MAKIVLHSKVKKSLMPTAVMSSDWDVCDDVEGNFVDETYDTTDEDVAMHPVTPEYRRSIDGDVCNIVTEPLVTAQRRLFLPALAEEERYNMTSFNDPMPMMPYDGMMMPLPIGSFFLPPPMPEYAQAGIKNETSRLSFAKKDDQQGCESSRIRFGCDKAVKLPKTPPNKAVKHPKTPPKEADHWTKQIKAAKEFRKLYGHCCIPYKYPPNPSLVRVHLLSFVVWYALPHCADFSLC